MLHTPERDLNPPDYYKDDIPEMIKCDICGILNDANMTTLIEGEQFCKECVEQQDND